ncbi:MAG: hypothetical protein HY833_00075 [Candidatus Aenigmarchaeota archaeon]|nr:hypothetical protein [Candidatus Aenigmarchaeota archaeon]
MAKKDEQRTEVAVAILTVVAIFSFAGILSWGGVEEELSERTAPNIVKSQVVGGSDGAAQGLPDEGMRVVETASAEVAPSAEAPAAFGTSLTPATSQFSVDEGTELSRGTIDLVVS